MIFFRNYIRTIVEASIRWNPNFISGEITILNIEVEESTWKEALMWKPQKESNTPATAAYKLLESIVGGSIVKILMFSSVLGYFIVASLVKINSWKEFVIYSEFALIPGLFLFYIFHLRSSLKKMKSLAQEADSVGGLVTIPKFQFIAICALIALIVPLTKFFLSETRQDLENALIIPATFPFDITVGTWLLAYGSQLIMISICFCIFFSFMLYVVTVSKQIIKHIDNLLDILSRQLDRSPLEVSYKPLAPFIKHLQFIIKLHKELKDVCSIFLLSFFTIVIWLICSSAASIKGITDKGIFLKFFMKGFQEILLLLVFCWTSEQVNTAYEEAAFRVYSSKWLNLPLNEKKSFLTATLIFNKQLYLSTAMGQTANYKTFLTILNSTYSLFSVIVAMT